MNPVDKQMVLKPKTGRNPLKDPAPGDKILAGKTQYTVMNNDKGSIVFRVSTTVDVSTDDGAKQASSPTARMPDMITLKKWRDRFASATVLEVSGSKPNYGDWSFNETEHALSKTQQFKTPSGIMVEICGEDVKMVKAAKEMGWTLVFLKNGLKYAVSGDPVSVSQGLGLS